MKVFCILAVLIVGCAMGAINGIESVSTPSAHEQETKQMFEKIVAWSRGVDERMAGIHADKFAGDFTPESAAKGYSREVAIKRQCARFRAHIGEAILNRLKSLVLVSVPELVSREAAQVIVVELQQHGFDIGWDKNDRIYIYVPIAEEVAAGK